MLRLQRIQFILQNVLEPKHLEIYNESGRHHVPKDSETHFKVVVVSSHFDNLSKIARQRIIYRLLAEELQTGLHALTMHLYTEEEWEAEGSKTRSSPACRDGYSH